MELDNLKTLEEDFNKVGKSQEINDPLIFINDRSSPGSGVSVINKLTINPDNTFELIFSLSVGLSDYEKDAKAKGFWELNYEKNEIKFSFENSYHTEGNYRENTRQTSKKPGDEWSSSFFSMKSQKILGYMLEERKTDMFIKK